MRRITLEILKTRGGDDVQNHYKQSDFKTVCQFLEFHGMTLSFSNTSNSRNTLLMKL